MPFQAGASSRMAISTKAQDDNDGKRKTARPRKDFLSILEYHQRIARLKIVALPRLQAQAAGLRRENLRFHLHRLHDGNRIALCDRRAVGDAEGLQGAGDRGGDAVVGVAVGVTSGVAVGVGVGTGVGVVSTFGLISSSFFHSPLTGSVTGSAINTA